jgi:hypothetical protein
MMFFLGGGGHGPLTLPLAVTWQPVVKSEHVVLLLFTFIIYVFAFHFLFKATVELVIILKFLYGLSYYIVLDRSIV